MFPLKDDNPTRRFPILTVILILVNAVMFFLEASLDERQRLVFLTTYGLVPAQLAANPLGPAVLTLFTSQFLHAGLFHVAGNMLYLWIFGNNIEDHLGRALFLPFYLGAGAVAGLAQVLTHPQSAVPTIGASGAVAGVLGAYLVLFPRARVYTLVLLLFFIRVIPVPAALWLGIWFVLQVSSAMGSLGAQSGVAWFAHAGGFLFGLLVVLLFAPRPRVSPLRDEFDRARWT